MMEFGGFNMMKFGGFNMKRSYFPVMMRKANTKYFFFSLLFVFAAFFARDVFGWPWSRDMYSSPVKKYNNLPLGESEGVPRGRSGLNSAILLKRKLGNPILVKNSLDVKNPVRPTEESIRNGERLYKIYCISCHGASGKGDGEVAKKMVPPPALDSDYLKEKPDSYIYATISVGGAIMPTQKKGLSDKEIWDIVNFIRKLQGFDVMKRWEEQWGMKIWEERGGDTSAP